MRKMWFCLNHTLHQPSTEFHFGGWTWKRSCSFVVWEGAWLPPETKLRTPYSTISRIIILLGVWRSFGVRIAWFV
ncbi:hypothetical protein VIGAN_04426300 [Vigna angularis var. angularis]|uniref:Uncharacterized protein n=1 Tax=Vigna angularis var. angularis TaxID=157739 RepID=A0A0S3S164_PHAAN|nr:hypothetical protein VIGAN_04426300 [Vigna angularis var. angularis]